MASPNEKNDIHMLPISDSSRSVSLAITSSAIDYDANGWSRLFATSFYSGVLNPHSELFRIWTKFFVMSVLVALFLDPLFFFLIISQT